MPQPTADRCRSAQPTAYIPWALSPSALLLLIIESREARILKLEEMSVQRAPESGGAWRARNGRKAA
jgi:hypothetical protein